jgi:dTDP-4-dehydrorhamnose reductase
MKPQRTLLVTGGHGFVAGSVLAQIEGTWDAHALSRSAPAMAVQGCTWHEADLADHDGIARLLDRVRPEAILHTAAVADIDFCEAHRDLARAVNVDLTCALASWCQRRGARFVLCSTDTVFDGEHAPYREADPPGPINIYAETKVAAERAVAAMLPSASIARLSLVIGLPVLGAGNSLLARLVGNLREGREIRMPTNEVRTPIDVLTLGRALIELAGNRMAGVVHLAGRTRINRYDMSRIIADRLGLPAQLILPTDSPAAPGRAPRPRDVSLDITGATSQLSTPMVTLERGLDLILEHERGRTAMTRCGAPRDSDPNPCDLPLSNPVP